MVESIGGFAIQGELGRGAKGVVYRGYDPASGQSVAIKVIAGAGGNTPQAVARFERECEATSRLQHPHIVRVVRVGTTQGMPFLAMELVEGEDLDHRLSRSGPFEPLRAAEFALQLASALAHAHERQVLHRDLKPANVMVHPQRGPLLTDFGLAKVFGPGAGISLTQSREFLGSPAYMAPEQAAAKHDQVSERTDVYGLGGILYEMLTGSPPFWGASLQQVLLRIVHEPPKPPSALRAEVPLGLDAICLRCLEKEPEQRYQSAQELADALESFLVNPNRVERGATDRQQLVLAGLLGVLTLVVGGVALALLLRPQSKPRATPTAPSTPPPSQAPPASPSRISPSPPPSPPAQPSPSPTRDVQATPVARVALPENDVELLALPPAQLRALLRETSAASFRAMNDPRTHLDRARVLLAMGDLPKAREAARSALRREELGAAHRVLAMIHLRENQREEGHAELKRAIELDAADWQAHRELGTLDMNARRFADARAHFTAWIETNPSADAYGLRAYLWSLEGRNAECKRDFERALQLDPQHANALVNLSTFAEAERDLKKASDYLGRYLAVAPESLEQWARHLQILEAIDDYEGLLLAAQACERAHPTAAEGPLWQGVVLGGRGRLQEALPLIETAVERAPKHPTALLKAIALHSALSNWERVVTLCDQALALGVYTPDWTQKIQNTRAIAQQKLAEK